jgi:ATP/maltotriose-dependent transcriptional regulator MalT
MKLKEVNIINIQAAPAGFGKTNLLIEWTKETPLPVAWLTLDGDDNELSRFIRYAIGALQTVEPGLGEEALALDPLQSPQGDGWKIGLTLLINELSALPKELVVVFDDFHTLEDSMILQRIDFFLKHSPPNLHLIIASRSEPEVDLAFLRAKGRVVELGVDDLRFTDPEVVQYFQQAIEKDPAYARAWAGLAGIALLRRVRLTKRLFRMRPIRLLRRGFVRRRSKRVTSAQLVSFFKMCVARNSLISRCLGTG